jgi:general secretion pathway protein D
MSIFKRLYRQLIALGVLSATVVYAETSTLNFRDVEIETAVESIAAITGKTFVVDPRIKGKVTIISSAPVKSDDVYDIFLSSLLAQGFQAVNDGKTIRILPAAKAANSSSFFDSSEFITEIIPVQEDEGDAYVGVLKPLLGPGAVVTFNKASSSIIVSDSKSQITRFKKLIEGLEKEAGRDFEIISLDNLSASDFVFMAKATGLLNKRTSIVEDTYQNRVIISGPVITRYKLKKLIEQLDVKDSRASASSSIDVVFLSYADAVTTQPIVESIVKSMLKQDALSSSNKKNSADKSDVQQVSIQADEKNNALVIASTKQIIELIKGVIAKLDIPRSQVLIEAVIAEVSEEFFRQLNVNLAAVGSSGVYLADFNSVLSSLAAAQITGDIADEAAALSNLQGVPTIAGKSTRTGNTGLVGLVQAIRTDTKNTLLSTPSVLTLENEEATISIAKEVPFVTGSYTSGTTGATNPFQTIERKEVGTILKVKPQVSSNDSIRLDIRQEVSNIDPTSVNGQETNYMTDKKVIDTRVMVGPNQTLVLGGLIDRKNSLIENKVPLLGDLPLLGQLFRSKQRAEDTTVLMVFIRPTLLRDAAEAKVITEQKYRLLHGRYEDFINRETGDATWLGKAIDEKSFPKELDKDLLLR